MTLASQVGANNFSIDDIKKLRHVEVILNDLAVNACWTNLTESREYAEEKLRSVGATLYAGEAKNLAEFHALEIRVDAARQKANGLCYGAIIIGLATGIDINGFSYIARPMRYQRIFTFQQKANNLVIESIQDFFNDDKAPRQNNTQQQPVKPKEEVDRFRLSVQKCWVVDLASPAAKVTVKIGFKLGSDGKVQAGSIRLLGTNTRNKNYATVAFQAARRAILRCQKGGYNIPDDFPINQQIVITFDPSKMKMRN